MIEKYSSNTYNILYSLIFLLFCTLALAQYAWATYHRKMYTITHGIASFIELILTIIIIYLFSKPLLRLSVIQHIDNSKTEKL